MIVLLLDEKLRKHIIALAWVKKYTSFVVVQLPSDSVTDS